MKRPRWWQHLRAVIGNYFWLPCIICGRYSGGQEWKSYGGMPASVPDPDKPGVGIGICPVCTREGYGWPDDVVIPWWVERCERGEVLGV